MKHFSGLQMPRSQGKTAKKMTHIADSTKKASQSLPLLLPKRTEIMTAIIECIRHTGHCAEHFTSIHLLIPVSNYISTLQMWKLRFGGERASPKPLTS